MTNSLSPNFSQSFASLTKRSIYIFLLTLSIGNFLAHAEEVSSGLSTPTPTPTCKDNRRRRIKVDGRRPKLCKYCGREDTEVRCNTTYEKKKTKTTKNGEKKEVILTLDPKLMCTCTCANYLDDSDDLVQDSAEEDEKLCPAENPLESQSRSANTSRSSIKTLEDRDTCSGDGTDVYQKGQECKYNWLWKGCTLETLKCEPAVSCMCRPDFIPPNTSEGWSCMTNFGLDCPVPDRGQEDLRPDQRGQACEEGDVVVPRSQSGADASGDLLVIRRRRQ